MRKTHPESLYNIWNFLELNPVVISRIAQCTRQGNNSHANRCSQFLLHKLFNKLDAKLKFPISAIWSQTVCTSNCFLLFKTMHNSLCMIKIQSIISAPVSSIQILFSKQFNLKITLRVQSRNFIFMVKMNNNIYFFLNVALYYSFFVFFFFVFQIQNEISLMAAVPLMPHSLRSTYTQQDQLSFSLRSFYGLYLATYSP